MDNAGNVKDGESMKYPFEGWLPYAEALFQLMNLQEKTMKKIKKSLTTLLTGEARELLDCAGCADVEIIWGSTPAESVEAIMQAAGLR